MVSSLSYCARSIQPSPMYIRTGRPVGSTTGIDTDALATACPTVAINCRAMSDGLESFVFGEHDHAYLVVELNERLRRVARIPAAVADVHPVLDAADIDAEAGPGDAWNLRSRVK
jgi:hypothetical protein